MSKPRRQARQVPPVIFGWTITGSPTLIPSTSLPTSSTQPAFSWPMISGRSLSPVGSVKGRQTPSTMCRSVLQTPAPPIRTMTSVDFLDLGVGNRLLGDPLLGGQRVVIASENLGLHERSSFLRAFAGLAATSPSRKLGASDKRNDFGRLPESRCPRSERPAAIGVQNLDIRRGRRPASRRPQKSATCPCSP